MFGALGSSKLTHTVADGHVACGFLVGFDCAPKVLGQDAQVEYIFNDPVLRRIEASWSFAGVGVFDEPLAVPNQAPDVEFVIENTGAASPVSVDG